MPDLRSDARSNSGFMVGLAVGLGVAALILVLGYGWVRRSSDDVRKGWNLVPVLVVTADVASHTPLSTANVGTRMLPEQFITSSVVRPDKAGMVIGQKVMVPMQAGDPVLWSEMESLNK
jgi:pilus assembly protein CpaB